MEPRHRASSTRGAGDAASRTAGRASLGKNSSYGEREGVWDGPTHSGRGRRKVDRLAATLLSFPRGLLSFPRALLPGLRLRHTPSPSTRSLFMPWLGRIRAHTALFEVIMEHDASSCRARKVSGMIGEVRRRAPCDPRTTIGSHGHGAGASGVGSDRSPARRARSLSRVFFPNDLDERLATVLRFPALRARDPVVREGISAVLALVGHRSEKGSILFKPALAARDWRSWKAGAVGIAPPGWRDAPCIGPPARTPAYAGGFGTLVSLPERPREIWGLPL